MNPVAIQKNGATDAARRDVVALPNPLTAQNASATHPTEGRTKKTLSPKTYWLPLAGGTYLSCKDNKRTQRALLKPMLSILTTAVAALCSHIRGINRYSLREK